MDEPADTLLKRHLFRGCCPCRATVVNAPVWQESALPHCVIQPDGEILNPLSAQNIRVDAIVSEDVFHPSPLLLLLPCQELELRGELNSGS